MNPFVMRALLALYPRDWRDRYGAEVARLTDELIAKGETTPWRGALDLVASAVVEWGRALADLRHAALVTAVAALIAVAGGYLIIAYPWPGRTPATTSSAASPARLGCVVYLQYGDQTVALVMAKAGGSSQAPVWAVELRKPGGTLVPATASTGPCPAGAGTFPMLCWLGPGLSPGATPPAPVTPDEYYAPAPVTPDEYAAIRCTVPSVFSAAGTANGASGWLIVSS
jgi:hypothetical protein